MNSSGSSSTSSVRQRASASAPQMLPPAQDDLWLEDEPDASLAQGVVEVREHEVLVELSLPVRRAEEPDARLEMLLALRVREGRLRVAVVAELLGGLERIDAHRGEEPDGGVVAGDDLAHAPVDLVQKLLVERDEQAEVVLSPIARAELALALHAPEHSRHLGYEELPLLLPVPLVEDRQVVDVEGDERPLLCGVGPAPLPRGLDEVAAAKKSGQGVQALLASRARLAQAHAVAARRVRVAGLGAFPAVALAIARTAKGTRPLAEPLVEVVQDGERLPIDEVEEDHGVAHGYRKLLSLEPDRLRELGGDLLAQRDELGAAGTVREAAAAQDREQAGREQAQRAVARLVAERRVDLGDAVDLDSQKPAAVLAVAAVVDGGHERADVAQPRGQVGVLGYAPVRDDAGDERRDAGVRVPVQAEGAALADHEGARRVAGAVLGGEMVGLSLEELPCALQVGREVVGMDVLAPDLGLVLEVGRGYAEVGDGVGGPA